MSQFEEQTAGPTEISDPRLRFEMKRAFIWLGMALAIVGVVVPIDIYAALVAGDENGDAAIFFAVAADVRFIKSHR